jgi:hypothetical protein
VSYFSPAPWRYSVEGTSKTGIVADANGIPLLRFYADRGTPEDRTLAAAAPELVEALIMCEPILTEGSDTHQMVVEALTKAGVKL